MADLIVETNGRPTPASQKGWIGAGIGAAIGGGPFGAVVGYFIGKKVFGEDQEKKELSTNQKTVPEPTLFNYQGARGFAIAVSIAAVALTPIAWFGFVGGALATLATAAIGLAAGYKEAQRGLAEMTVEYQQAEAQQRSQAQSRGVSRQRTEPAVEYETPARTVSHVQEQEMRRAGVKPAGFGATR